MGEPAAVVQQQGKEFFTCVRREAFLKIEKATCATCAHGSFYNNKSPNLLSSSNPASISAMTDKRRYFAVAAGGSAKLNSMCLTTEEADTLIAALQGTLVSDLEGGKNKKITREVLAKTLSKIAVRSDVVVERNCQGKASEDRKKELDENLRKKIEAAVSTEGQPAAADSASSDETVCRFYRVGKCKFSRKSNDKGSQCPKSHPPACRQFDQKGPDGCDIECSRGKFHRSVCEKLLKGECLRKAGQCKWYHPPLLSKKVLAERKKKEEEEDKLEMKSLLEELRQFKQAHYLPMQTPLPIYQLPPTIPSTTRRDGRKLLKPKSGQ